MNGEGCLSCKCTYETGCKEEQRAAEFERVRRETRQASRNMPPSQRTPAQQGRYFNRHDIMAAVRAAKSER